MDELTKFRITGAVIWLALLILLVPSWYANPVDYEKSQPWLSTNSEVGGAVSDDLLHRKQTHKPEQTSQPKLTPEKAVTSAGSPQQADKKPEPIKELAEQSTITPAELGLTDTTAPDESSQIKEPATGSEDKSPAWLVRVASYNSIQSANRTLGLLEMRYEVTIGDFSTKSQKIYSVRVGPFFSLQEAEEAKQTLDKELVTDSVIVQIR